MAEKEAKKTCKSYNNGNCSILKQRGKNWCQKCSAYWPLGDK